jgi:hypothetical protein
MTERLFDQLITCQQALIAALDRRDVEAISEATNRLAVVVEQCRQRDAWRTQPENRAQLEQVMRLSSAVRIRVNYLTDWTRQQLDHLRGLRGMKGAGLYSNRHH